jgi:hypothetical protein
LPRVTAILDFFARWATQRNILLLLAVFFVFNVGLVPVASRHLESLSSGVGLLDARLAYTPDEAYTSLAAYGEAGRRFYLLTALTLDVLYPVVYTLFFSLTIVFCLRQALPPAHTLQRAALLPWVGMLADLAENAGIVWLLLNYPHRLDGLATLASTFTTIKWLFALAAMVATAGGLVALVVHRSRRQPLNPP